VRVKAHSPVAASSVLAVVCMLHVASAYAQIAPPTMVFHGRFWNSISGWEPKEGDAAYIEFTPTGNIDADVEAIANSDLKNAPPEQRMLGTNSVKYADRILEELIRNKGFGISYLGFDLERRPQTPKEEQDDPVKACRAALAVAREYEMPFLVVPTGNISAQWGERLAPYADMFQPQGKGYQAHDTAFAINTQRNLYRKLKAVNPKLVIYHDMAMVPKGKHLPLADLLDYYYGCSDMVEANSIWATERHRPMLTKYVLTVRPPKEPPEGVRSPVITGSATASNTNPVLGENVTFGVEAQDPDGDDMVFTWDFGDHREWGDGNVLVRGKEVDHVYSKAGRYTATVTVTDGKGGSVSSTVLVVVKDDADMEQR